MGIRIPRQERQVTPDVGNVPTPQVPAPNRAAFGENLIQAQGQIAEPIARLGDLLVNRARQRQQQENDQNVLNIANDFQQANQKMLFDTETEDVLIDNQQVQRPKGFLNRQGSLAKNSVYEYDKWAKENIIKAVDSIPDVEYRNKLSNLLRNDYQSTKNTILKHEVRQDFLDKKETYANAITIETEKGFLAQDPGNLKRSIESIKVKTDDESNFLGISDANSKDVRRRKNVNLLMQNAVNGSLSKDPTGISAIALLDTVKNDISPEEYNTQKTMIETTSKSLMTNAKAMADRQKAQKGIEVLGGVINGEYGSLDVSKIGQMIANGELDPNTGKAAIKGLTTPIDEFVGETKALDISGLAFIEETKNLLDAQGPQEVEKILVNTLDSLPNTKEGIQNKQLLFGIAKDYAGDKEVRDAFNRILDWQAKSSLTSDQQVKEYFNNVKKGMNRVEALQASIDEEVNRQSSGKTKEKFLDNDISNKIQDHIESTQGQSMTGSISLNVLEVDKGLTSYLMRSGIPYEEAVKQAHDLTNVQGKNPAENADMLVSNIRNALPQLKYDMPKTMEAVEKFKVFHQILDFLNPVSEAYAAEEENVSRETFENLRDPYQEEYASLVAQSIDTKVQSIRDKMTYVQTMRDLGLVDKIKSFLSESGKSLATGFVSDIPASLTGVFTEGINSLKQIAMKQLEKDGAVFGISKEEFLSRSEEQKQRIRLNSKFFEKLENIENTSEKLRQDFVNNSQWDAIKANPKLFQGSFMQNPSWTRAVALGLRSAPNLGLASLISYATRSPIAGATVLGSFESAEQRRLAREAGASNLTQNMIFISDLVALSYLESIPLTGFMKGGNLLARTSRGVIQEGSEEILQGLYKNMNAKLGYDDTVNLTSGLVESFIAGGISGGIIGGLHPSHVSSTDELLEKAKKKGIDTDLLIEKLSSGIAPYLDKVNSMMADRVNSDVKRFGLKTLSETSGQLGFVSENAPLKSNLQAVVSYKFSPVVTGKQALNTLKNSGLSKEEIDFSGIDKFLQSKEKFTRKEITDYIEQNKVKVEPVVKTTRELSDASIARLMVAENLTRDEAIALIESNPSKSVSDKTKYSSYTLPGGENYQETLLTVPGTKTEKGTWIARRGEEERIVTTFGEKTKLKKDGWEISESPQQEYQDPLYKSSHWDEPNVLVHHRTNQRTDAHGNNGTFVEEIQSDWHREGKSKGYQGTLSADEQKKLKSLENKLNNIEKNQIENDTILKDSYPKLSSDELAYRKALQEDLRIAFREFADEIKNFKGAYGVPDAPFKNTWHELALKDIIRQAVERGDKFVAFISGQQTADRYDLSKQVEQIGWQTEEGVKRVFIPTKGGKNIRFQIDKNGLARQDKSASMLISSDIEGKKVEDILGKDIGQKVLSNDKGLLRENELKIGGEWAKKFYDEILPKSAEKYIKKWGSSVTTFNIDTGTPKKTTDIARMPTKNVVGKEYSTQKGFYITPQMVKEVKEIGQPLFGNRLAGGIGKLSEERGMAGVEGQDPLPDEMPEKPLIFDELEGVKQGAIPEFKSTEDAESFGRTATPEQIKKLEVDEASFRSQAEEIRKKGMNTTDAEDELGYSLGQKAQLYREAIKASKEVQNAEGNGTSLKETGEQAQGLEQGAEGQVRLRGNEENVMEAEGGEVEPAVNIENLNISEAAKAKIKKATETISDEIKNQTGKPITHEEVFEKAKEADLLTKGSSREKMVEFQAALLKTRQQLAALAEQKELTPEFLDTLRVVANTGTDIASQLQSFRIDAFPEYAAVKTKIIKELMKLGYASEEIIDAGQGVDFTDLQQVTEFYRKFVDPKLSDVLNEFAYINILSSPKTHIVNIFSNLIQTAGLNPITKLATTGVDAVASLLTGNDRQYYLDEIPAFYKGALNAIPEASKAVGDALQGKAFIERPDISRIPTNSKFIDYATFGIGKYVPRALEAMDVFFRTMIEKGEIEALTAKYQKQNDGKSPSEKEQVNIEKEARRKAEYYVFRQKPDEANKSGQGDLLSAVDKMTNAVYKLRKVPGARWFVRFVQTPMNILKQGIEYSPAGFATVKGAENKSEQIAKALIGSVLVATSYAVAASGRTTWALPRSKKDREEFYAAGRIPYAVKIGDTWYSYSKLGPLAYPLAIGAAIHYYEKESPTALSDSAIKKASDALAGVMGFFADQSYVRSLGDLIKAIQGEQYKISSLITSVPTQLIPLSSLQRWVNSFTDPLYRDKEKDLSFETIVDNMKSSIVGLSKTIEPKKDSKGKEIKKENVIENALSPIAISKEKPREEMIYKRTVERKQRDSIRNKKYEERRNR